MKKPSLLFLLIAASYYLIAQNVTTLIGPDIGINDALVFDSHGNLYGSDHEGLNVYKYSPEGDLSVFATFSHHPNGMVMDGEDNLYVSTPPGNKIFKIAPEGTITQYGPDIPNPNGIIFEYDSDTMIVTSYPNNTVGKLAPDGVFTPWLSNNGLNGPLGLSYDQDHVLYVANFNDGKIFRVENDQLVYFATIPGGYVGIDYFSTGYIQWSGDYLYATGFGVNKIFRVNMQGLVEDFAGSGIAGLQDGAASTARFYYPNGICASKTGDSLFISDYETHAVRIISDINTDVHSTKQPGFQFKCFPNPVFYKAYIRLEVPREMETYYQLVDMKGLFVAQGKWHLASGENQREISTSFLPSGTYTLTVSSKNEHVSQPIIVSN
jgi:sugar lactone lactonase YvrE